MSTTGSAVDALQRELIKTGTRKHPNLGRPKKPYTKALVKKLEKELRG